VRNIAQEYASFPHKSCDTAPPESRAVARPEKFAVENHSKLSGVEMNVIQTALPGVLIIEPKRFGDERGFFVETYQVRRYQEAGIAGPFVQDNLSRSQRGVLRGLHLQNPNPQSKLVTALRGTVLDVAVDVRVGSPTFKQHVAVELSGENGRQFYVPKGFAHGFVVLSETADFFYKCDALYSPSDEIVVRWDDPEIGIDWRTASPSLGERDKSAPLLSQINKLPTYSS
jgi:dTDP-4-dehydrorhamnose 3,5-epimerase